MKVVTSEEGQRFSVSILRLEERMAVLSLSNEEDEELVVDEEEEENRRIKYDLCLFYLEVDLRRVLEGGP